MARTITFDDVYRRKKCLSNSRDESIVDMTNQYRLAEATIELHSSESGSIVDEFYKRCRNGNIDGMLKECVDIATRHDSYPNKLKHVIPYVKNLNTLSDYVESSNIDTKMKHSLSEEIEVNEVCDRVIKNDNAISKRFNMNRFINDNLNRDMDDVVFETCRLLDTFNLPSHGKLNVALESLSCYFQQFGKPYDELELVKLVEEYYLLTTPDNDSNRSRYDQIIQENHFISSKTKTLLEGEKYVVSDDVEKVLNKFNKEENKDLSKLKRLLTDLYRKDPAQIVDGTPSLLHMLRHFVELGVFGINPIAGIVMLVVNVTISMKINDDHTKKLISKFTSEIATVEKKIDKMNDGKAKTNMESYLKSLRDAKDKIVDWRSKHIIDKYDEEELERKKNGGNDNDDSSDDDFDFDIDMNFESVSRYSDKLHVEGITEAVEFNPPSSNNRIDRDSDIYAYTHNSLSTLREEANTMCSILNRTGYRDSLSKFTENLYIGSISPRCNIVEEGYIDGNFVDIPVAIYAVKESVMNELPIYQSLGEVCDKMNTYHLKENHKAYYTKNYNYPTSCFEVHIIDTNALSLTEQEDRIVNSYIQCNENVYSEASYVLTEKANINGLQLFMQGLKKKARDFSAKEQQICRELDAAVNLLTRSIKSALVSDRREAIIKGSIIPSFTKCMKLCIPLGILAKFNPGLAIITIFCGFAASKNLTAKERSLMLDEIEIELKVVEKELSRQEEKGNMKKYRELLTYQKKLQREHQRIKYKLKGGTVNLPDTDSTN